MFKSIKKALQTIDRKMLYLLAALVLFMSADALMTQVFVPAGKALESNKLLAPLVGQASFIVLKIVGALICAFLLWHVHRRFPKVGLIATWIAVIGCGAILLWNASLMLLI